MKESTVSSKVVKKERRKVSVEQFTPKEVENQIVIDGRANAYESVNVTSKVTGIMKPSTRIRKGQYKRKGSLLFEIDSRESVFNLKAQRAAFMTSITQMMADLKFDYPQAFDHWKSYLNNFDVEKPIAELPASTSEQEKYFISSRNLYNQYYTIKRLETQLTDYRIYAPFSGVITQVNIFPGGLVSQGANLATMINTTVFELESPVQLDDLQYIKVGQSVKLRSDNLNQEWTGKVSRIATQIDQNTQNLPVYITVSGSGLKDGMYLSGTLKGAPINDVIELPKSIFTSPKSIFVVRDSTIQTKIIESVKRLDESVIVRGLSPNDKVVVGSLAGLQDGQKITY